MGKVQNSLSWSLTPLNRLFTGFKRFARKTLVVIGIISGVALASMLFGLAIDASPASNMGMGPDWEYALKDPTWWGVAEKLFTCMVVGYMLGIIPGGLVTFVVAAWISVRRESMEEANRTRDIFLECGMFELLDQDKDGKIRDKDLLELHPRINVWDQEVLQHVIQNRAQIGSVEVLPDGIATYTITATDLRRYPKAERERFANLEWTFIGCFFAYCAVAFAEGILAASGLLILAEAVLFYYQLKQKVRLQRFIQREFASLDANSDGLIDELEIVQLWPKLPESERALLTKLQHRIGNFGHELKRDGLTIRGITRLEADTCVPTLAHMIV